LPNNPPDFGRDFAVLRKRRIRTGRNSLWGFLDRHDITLEKRCRPLNGSALTSPARDARSRPTLDSRARAA
jgi:hypothetical protein